MLVCAAVRVTAAAAFATNAALPDPVPALPGVPVELVGAPLAGGRIEAGSLPDLGRTMSLPCFGDFDALNPSTVPALRA